MTHSSSAADGFAQILTSLHWRTDVNSNAFHNAANIASLLLAAGTAALLVSGCTQTPGDIFDCSGSWINPAYTTAVIAALQGLKLIVNIVRDGLGGLIKPQPPVGQ